jgi:hypothetical protein
MRKAAEVWHRLMSKLKVQATKNGKLSIRFSMGRLTWGMNNSSKEINAMSGIPNFLTNAIHAWGLKVP